MIGTGLRCSSSDMITKQPLPQSSATSASAWSALLRSHMSNVEPIVNQWRGTLDTLLIFVSVRFEEVFKSSGRLDARSPSRIGCIVLRRSDGIVCAIPYGPVARYGRKDQRAPAEPDRGYHCASRLNSDPTQLHGAAFLHAGC